MERPIDKGNDDYEEWMDYIKKLEKYCDYIEKINKHLRKEEKEYQDVIRKYIVEHTSVKGVQNVR
jgi:hypothetical protein